MNMKVSNVTIDKMQILLKEFFNANAKSDNIAYWLGYNYYNNIEKIYHQKWAHAFPGDQFADGLSNMMLKLGIRPVRLALENHTKDFNNLIEVFDENKNIIEVLVNEIHELIELAELNGDVEVKLYAEELALIILDYEKQAEEWAYIAKVVSPSDMNIHIEKYTNFIK